jgi:hypothetical protein
MKRARKHVAAAIPATDSDQGARMQEGIRAKKELDAYFKGLRTDREARAALKMIKAFVRERERQDPSRRIPFTTKAPVPRAEARTPHKQPRRHVSRTASRRAGTKRPTPLPATVAPGSEPEAGNS